MKKRLFVMLGIIGLIGLMPAPISLGQTASVQTPMSIGEFIARTVTTRTKENDEIKKEKLRYKRVYTVDNLNDNEQVVDREKEEVVVIEPGGNERMIEKNGKPVSKGKSSRPKIELIKVLEAMLKLDEFNIAGIETLDNRPHYVISFKPKSGQRTGSGDVEEIIVRSEGVMYVDIEKFYIKRISAWITRPYSRAWGIFSLTRANLDMTQEEFGDIVVMKSIVLTDRYSLLFGSTFEKQTFLYKDYQ